MNYFEYLDLAPIEVQNIVNKFNEKINSYQNCSDLIDELRAIGWDCEYGLDAMPYNLRPMNICVRCKKEKPINQFLMCTDCLDLVTGNVSGNF